MEPHELRDQIQKLGEREMRVFASLLRRQTVVKDVNKEFVEQLTLGQRVADRVASFGGSWPFIVLFLTGMLVWMLINKGSAQPFDPYPFILLNLVLSCLAALQAPVIMMSQNRQTMKDRLEARHDYEVNLKAEMEVMGLHTKLDQLRDGPWSELLARQQRQVELLEEIHALMSRDSDGRNCG
jgi:uncharacterized membrane protein